MRKRITTIFFLFVVSTKLCFSSGDTTLPGNTKPPASYRKSDVKLLVGGNLQQAYKHDGQEYSRKYFEIGVHKTVTASYGHHPATAFTHGPSVEIAPEINPIYGFKYSAWAEVWLMVLGLSAVYYSDLTHGNFKIRPEFGIGAAPFKLTAGFNVPTIGNKNFKELQRAQMQVTLNILLKLKTLKKE